MIGCVGTCIYIRGYTLYEALLQATFTPNNTKKQFCSFFLETIARSFATAAGPHQGSLKKEHKSDWLTQGDFILGEFKFSNGTVS